VSSKTPPPLAQQVLCAIRVRLHFLTSCQNRKPDVFLHVLKPASKGPQRCLPVSVTFWAFVSQVLSPNSSCREVVRKVEAWWRWQHLRTAVGVTPSAYCQARARLDLELLRMIRRHLSFQMERNALNAERWLGDAPLRLSMAPCFPCLIVRRTSSCGLNQRNRSPDADFQ